MTIHHTALWSSGLIKMKANKHKHYTLEDTSN